MILQQILLTPLFLSRWGINGYATWIAASAVASFASLANGGFGQAASAEIIFRIRANDRRGVISLFSNAISIILLLSVVWMLFIVSLAFAGVGGVGMKVLGPQGRGVIFLLNIVILQEFISAPFAALLGAAHGAGVSAGIKLVAKMLETSACVALLYFTDISQLGIASVMLFSSLLSFMTLTVMAIRNFPWIKYRLFPIDGPSMSTLIGPSLNNFLLFVSVSVIGIQLPRVIIPAILNPSALAQFATMTTYFRTVRSFCVLLPASLQIEASVAHGGGEAELFKRMCVFVLHSVIWLSMLGGVTAVLAGPIVYPLWTRNLISFDWSLGLILFLGVVCSAVFDGVSAFLISVNSLGRMPAIYSSSMLAAMLFGVPIAHGFGLNGYAAIMILPELLGIFLAMHQLRLVTNRTIPWRSLLAGPPWHEVLKIARLRR